MSIVGFREAGEASRPSPAIWADCPKELLNQEDGGFYFHEEFLGGAVSAAATAATTVGKGHMTLEADTDTVLAHLAARFGGVMRLETDADDNDAAAFVTQPMVEIIPFSGRKVWAEIGLELASVTADRGLFFGLAEEAALTRDVVADNAGALVGESLVGFQLLAADADAFDAVYKLDAGTVAVVEGDAKVATTATVFKLGLRFDGQDKLDFFVDGVRVARLEIDTTLFPVNVPMGVIFGNKTGTTAASTADVHFIRAAGEGVTS